MPFCLSTQILNGWDKLWLGGLQRHHVRDSNGLQTSSFRQQTPNYQQHLPSCWIVKGGLSFIIFHFSVDGRWYGSACCDWMHWYPTSSINKMPPCTTHGVRARILLHLCNPAKFGHVWGGLQTLDMFAPRANTTFVIKTHLFRRAWTGWRKRLMGALWSSTQQIPSPAPGMG